MAMRTERTSPKPFVFVLMPFDKRFDDVYALAIKAAAKEIGAYAERVDEQQYAEGILDRIFNQINKADVVVADMTGRNPNVFYEVGYAHALNKLVVLLTQDADDIPFDLKHRPHLVYGGRIEDLKKKLKTRLRWALDEAGRREVAAEEQFAVSLAGKELAVAGAALPTIEVWGEITEGAQFGDIPIRFGVRNDGSRASTAITHVYMFGAPAAPIYPMSSLSPDRLQVGDRARTRVSYPARAVDATDGLNEQFHLRGEIPSLPPGGLETGVMKFRFDGDVERPAANFRLRLLSATAHHDFVFELAITEIRVHRRPAVPPAPVPVAPTERSGKRKTSGMKS